MNYFERTVLAIVVVVLLAGGWFFRWEVTPITGVEGFARAYMLNRWTGTIYLLWGDERLDVKPSK